MSVCYKIGTDHQEKDNVVWNSTGYLEKEREGENKGVPPFPIGYLTVTANSSHLK